MTTPIAEGFTSVNVGLRKALDLYANLRPVRNLPAWTSRFQRRRPGHRPREHRGSLRRARARGRAGRRREPEDHHREGVDAHRAVRVRARAAQRPQAGHGHPQGEHHEAQRRPVPRLRAQGRARVHRHHLRRADRRRRLHAAGDEPGAVRRAAAARTSTATSSRISAPGWSAGSASCRARTWGPRCAVFEAVHGSAPDIAGKNLANPTALLLSARADAAAHRRAASAPSASAPRSTRVLADGQRPDARSRRHGLDDGVHRRDLPGRSRRDDAVLKTGTNTLCPLSCYSPGR